MKKRSEIIIHFFFWIISYLLLLTYTTTAGDFNKSKGPYWLTLLFGMLMNQMVFYGNAFYLIPRVLKGKKKFALGVLVLLYYLFINLLESYVDYSFLTNLFSSESEPFQSYFIYNIIGSLLFLCLAISYALINYWIKNEQQKRIIVEEKLSTEIAFLKSQINPHFLFNVLNSLYARSLKKDVPELTEAIAEVAELMRYMVYESKEDKVPLEKEIQHLRSFIQIHQLRIAEDDDVQFNLNVTGSVKNVVVSPILLIPFVENAVKHGVKPLAKSIVDIQLTVKKKNLHYKVVNTLNHKNTDLKDGASGFGLNNLRRRLSVLYPDKHKFNTKERDGYFISELHLILD